MKLSLRVLSVSSERGATLKDTRVSEKRLDATRLDRPMTFLTAA